MGMILAGLFCGIVILALLFQYVAHDGPGYEFVAAIGVIFTLILCAFVIAYLMLVLDWVGAEYKAKIINEEYNTSYTQSEVFWASSVIETIRQLDRKRIELNGDIMQQEKTQ